VSNLILDEVDWRSWDGERKAQLLHRLRYDWNVWSREEQRFPTEDCDVWVYLAGRGTGKTRSASEEAKKRAKVPNTRIAVVGPTHGVVRDVCIEGPSGILAVTPPREIKRYNRSTGQVWLRNGSAYFPYSSTEPDRLRGPEHHFAWVEEFAAHRYPQETWDMLVMGLRLGDHPQAAVTTTPRPLPVLKNLIADPRTIVTRGRTTDNAANLPESTLRYLLRRYANTQLGRQELEGLILEDVEGALWLRDWIDRDRTQRIVSLSEDGVTVSELPDMRRVVVGVDPAVTSGEDADETGIVVVGLDYENKLYVIDDLSMKGTPAQWAKQVLRAYKRYRADAVVAERNNGGDLVEETLKRAYRWMPVHPVWASKGKEARAQPIAYLYERPGHVTHVGSFPELEDQMCTWVPGERGNGYFSPDRLDALVWACTFITDTYHGGGLAVPVGSLPAGLGYDKW